MKKNFLSAIFVIICSTTIAQPAGRLYWRYLVGEKVDVFCLKVKKGDVFIPFANLSIKGQVIDSLTKSGLVFDSLVSDYQAGRLSKEPSSIIYRVQNNIIIYTGHFTMKGGRDTLYSFWINKGTELEEHDRFDFYYGKKMGVFAAFHASLDEKLPFDYDRYILKRYVNSRGKDVISTEDLERLAVTILEKFGYGSRH